MEISQASEVTMKPSTEPDEHGSTPIVSVQEGDKKKRESHRIQMTVKPAYFDRIERP